MEEHKSQQEKINNQIETVEEAKQVVRVLDNFDHKILDTKGVTKKEAVVISEASGCKYA